MCDLEFVIFILLFYCGVFLEREKGITKDPIALLWLLLELPHRLGASARLFPTHSVINPTFSNPLIWLLIKSAAGGDEGAQFADPRAALVDISDIEIAASQVDMLDSELQALSFQRPRSNNMRG